MAAVLHPAASERSNVSVKQRGEADKTSTPDMKADLGDTVPCLPVTAAAALHPSQAQWKSRSSSPGFTGPRSICSGT